MGGGQKLLPVLNQSNELISFAYEDEEANREIRMLDELSNCEKARNFRDVYSGYDGVTIHGFNELAFYFAEYLQRVGITVYTDGGMWGVFHLQQKECGVLDYKNFHVYGEGVEVQNEAPEWRESVSADFECIDKIYEDNICRGIIKDNNGSLDDLLEMLKGKKIALLGTGEGALNAYDLLVRSGIDIQFFISDSEEECTQKLFGKKILSRTTVMENFNDCIFIEPDSKNSAWGFGETDFYHYVGYERNKRFFLLRDYTEIPKNGMMSIIKSVLGQADRKLVLLGDLWLCLKLISMSKILDNGIYQRIVYCDVLEEHSAESREVNTICNAEINKNDICFLIIPEYYGVLEQREGHWVGCREKIKELYLNKLIDYTKSTEEKIIDYTLDYLLFEKRQCKISTEFKVRQIVIGSINTRSGNVFFRGLLDNHPDILVMPGYSYLNNNLITICERLAMKKGQEILELFWELLDEKALHTFQQQARWGDSKPRFNQSMARMMTNKEKFTPQELFIMIHIAQAEAFGREVKDISKIVIYWEPHFVPRDKCEDYVLWFGKEGITGCIINVVRNAYIRAGSILRNYEGRNRISYFGRDLVLSVLSVPEYWEKKEYPNWKRIVKRFEDIKCNPHKELQHICDELGIAWSDTLLETTALGKTEFYGGFTGLDLTPVYRIYEEYFSAFDRFRISMIVGTWQKQYGYPSVSSINFTRQELREMFRKEFRFEDRFAFKNSKEKQKFRKWVQLMASRYLWESRRKEVLEKYGL